MQRKSSAQGRTRFAEDDIGWVTILHHMMIIRQKLQRELREGKSFSQRCKRCDCEKKEGINVRLMRNLYPGATVTDTVIGCYLSRESSIGHRKSKKSTKPHCININNIML